MLALLLAFCATLCSATPKWTPVDIQSTVTHVQPMTGLVLWPHLAQARPEYTPAIQLEFSYCLPCKVVTGCSEDGTVQYDWSWFDRILDDVASRGHQLIARFRYEYPSSRDVDGVTRGATAVPQFIKDRPDYHETFNDTPGDGPTFYADWSNQALQQFTLQFYTDFAARYAHDPRLAFLEVGFGHWSEYHIFGTDLRLGHNFASKEFQRQFFLHLSRVMGDLPWGPSIDAGEVRYSPVVEDPELMALRFGLFDDSFMHQGHEIASGSGYNESLWRLIDKNERWKTGFCGGEISYYKASDQRQFLNPEGMYGHTWEEQSAKYHLTFMIANDAPSGPHGTPARFSQASMAVGYHFRVLQCHTSRHATRLLVTNTGTAPLYRDAYFAIDSKQSTTTLRGLLPGETREILIPAPLRHDRNGLALQPPTIVSPHILPTQEIQYDGTR